VSLARHSLQSLLAVRPLDRVYAGALKKDRREVLVRQLLPGLPEAEREGTAEVFSRHMQRMSDLQLPGTLPVREFVGSAAGPLYFVTDIPVGITLGELVKAAGSLPVPVAAAIGMRLAELLEHAHALDVFHLGLHRNVVLISADYSVTLLDLGLVPMLLERVQGRLRQVHTAWDFLYPEPGFVAPELLTGEEAGAHTDVYGLGTLLYLLGTAAPPFSGSSVVAYNAILSGQQESDPRTHVPDLHEGFSELVTSCLDRDPLARPEIGDVISALRQLALPLGDALDEYAPVLHDTSYIDRFEPLLRVVDGGHGDEPEPERSSPAVVPLFVDRNGLTEAELLAQMSAEQRRIYMAGAHADPFPDQSRSTQLKRGMAAGLAIAVVAVMVLLPKLTKERPKQTPARANRAVPAAIVPVAAAPAPTELLRPAEDEASSNRYRMGLETR
jgi:serine/threonine protein kinase